ncbi:MAG TPA: hypothetical protein VGG32_06865 [Thermoplasmata archaeon]|jgi:hypothetical protein
MNPDEFTDAEWKAAFGEYLRSAYPLSREKPAAGDVVTLQGWRVGNVSAIAVSDERNGVTYDFTVGDGYPLRGKLEFLDNRREARRVAKRFVALYGMVEKVERRQLVVDRAGNIIRNDFYESSDSSLRKE